MTMTQAASRLRNLLDTRYAAVSPPRLNALEWEAVTFAAAILGVFVEALEDVPTIP